MNVTRVFLSVTLRDLRSFEIRSDSNRPCLPIARRLKPLTVLSGTVHRLASSVSDHTPVLFNVFEDWKEESVVLHISFDSIRIRFERKRPVRRSLSLSGIYGRFDSIFDSNRNARFDSGFVSNANGRFAGPY